MSITVAIAVAIAVANAVVTAVAIAVAIAVATAVAIAVAFAVAFAVATAVDIAVAIAVAGDAAPRRPLSQKNHAHFVLLLFFFRSPSAPGKLCSDLVPATSRRGQACHHGLRLLRTVAFRGRPLPLALAVGRCRWLLPLPLAAASCRWLLPLSQPGLLTVGLCGWPLRFLLQLPGSRPVSTR